MQIQKAMKKEKKDRYIFIDESGTLPDPKGDVIVVAVVATVTPDKLITPTSQTRKLLNPKNKKVSELKFYTAGDKTRLAFLNELVSLDIDIFILTIQKSGQNIPDTSENFAILCWLLLEECILFYGDSIKQVIFDKHFHRQKDISDFNKKLLQLVNKKLEIKHAESINDTRVNTADMVAGSALYFHTDKDKQFYKILENRIISEKVLHWKEAKRRVYEIGQ